MGVPLSLNAEYIDAQYQLWKTDPNRVPQDWQRFFEGFELALAPDRKPEGICTRAEMLRQSHVEELIYRYRDLGHLLACLDPLAACPTEHPLLSLSAFHLTEADLDRTFFTPHFGNAGESSLRDILRTLKETYCRSIGVEYMHLQDPAERRWLQERMEPSRNRPQIDVEGKRRILRKLCEATLFEQFLNAKYIGQKRFSIEGAEVIVAMLEQLVQHLGALDYRELILGMAHRGRLNVQANVLEKPYEVIFCEFEGSYDPKSLVGSGDVKYHKGYMADVSTESGRPLRVLLATNPSHLEAVDPVVEGIARARQEHIGDDGAGRVLPLLIHGDAAFAGQGVVAETLNLSQLEGYRTGGTIHLVINNQIGFTTLPEDARSTRYSTDIAKMLMVPIFHVHGEDPEAAVHVIKLACDYRRTFQKDVVIDVVCYRRHGHNEGDEPYYTQPQMYDRIRERPPLYKLYAAELTREGSASEADLQAMEQEINACLTRGYESQHGGTCPAPVAYFYEEWKNVHGSYSAEPVGTGVAAERLIAIARHMSAVPEGISVHRKLERILARRVEAVEKGEGIDWATAELLAFGSLLLEGIPVRLSGQDSRRGTFSQRHSVLVDTQTGAHIVPLNDLEPEQAHLSVYDSLLSENAVLGFEYGYSLACPHMLVMWEAQFGDFANNAQVIIDQFIVSGELKWQRLSGLVLLLPHGFEGQGPEHSSGRIERFLQLCAEENMQVCYPSTPAQYFHLLRRQMKRPFRKILVVMTPKSLLRLPQAVSSRAELSEGYYRVVLDDPAPPEAVSRVIVCSGKVYYDLLERRTALGRSDIALLRLEQFYPFHAEEIQSVLSRYTQAREWFWVQEEPQNMGAWGFVRPRLEALIRREFGYIGRAESASPATGYMVTHQAEQSRLLDQAIGPKEG